MRSLSLDLSFSGLKTKISQYIKSLDGNNDVAHADIAYAVQEVTFSFLCERVDKIVHKYNFSEIVLVGGVAANKVLRKKLAMLSSKKGINVFYPQLKFCTDNAAMIAIAARNRMSVASYDYNADILPRWDLELL